MSACRAEAIATSRSTVAAARSAPAHALERGGELGPADRFQQVVGGVAGERLDGVALVGGGEHHEGARVGQRRGEAWCRASRASRCRGTARRGALLAHELARLDGAEPASPTTRMSPPPRAGAAAGRAPAARRRRSARESCRDPGSRHRDARHGRAVASSRLSVRAARSPKWPASRSRTLRRPKPSPFARQPCASRPRAVVADLECDLVVRGRAHHHLDQARRRGSATRRASPHSRSASAAASRAPAGPACRGPTR
jgi:hypothetical protein